MNKTNYFNNGQEFNSYYPTGIVPSNELGVVGSYNSIYSFIRDVFGIEGGEPLQAYIDITSNSNVDVSTYAYAYVNVPIPSGYIQPSGTYNITENGTFDITNYASTYVNVSGGGASTDTTLIIGFRNISNDYSIKVLNGENDSNIYLDTINLGTVTLDSKNFGMGSGHPYYWMDSSSWQPDNTGTSDFLNERKVSWIKINGNKEHILSTLPSNLSISMNLTAISRDGVGAPIFATPIITLPSNLQGKYCILIYDFIPDTSTNTYFVLNTEDSFII